MKNFAGPLNGTGNLYRGTREKLPTVVARQNNVNIIKIPPGIEISIRPPRLRKYFSRNARLEIWMHFSTRKRIASGRVCSFGKKTYIYTSSKLLLWKFSICLNYLTELAVLVRCFTAKEKIAKKPVGTYLRSNSMYLVCGVPDANRPRLGTTAKALSETRLGPNCGTYVCWDGNDDNEPNFTIVVYNTDVEVAISCHKEEYILFFFYALWLQIFYVNNFSM